MHGGDYLEHCMESAAALVERKMQQRELEQARMETRREPDWETDWDAVLKTGCALEKARHGRTDDYGRPGDDAYTAARREGAEPPAAPELPGWFGDAA